MIKMDKKYYKTECLSVLVTEQQRKDLEETARKETEKRQRCVSVGEIIRERVFATTNV